MCGIVGYVGSQNCVPILMEGLSSLAYRGYDSAGLAVQTESDALLLRKEEGKLENLYALLEREPLAANCGIGHTRWATHGVPSVANAHPHVDQSGKLALVHNGIIENYKKLKFMLQEQGVCFRSETDTEVAAQLIGSLYTGDPLSAIAQSLCLIEGAYALVILFADHPDTIYCARKDSPMVVGLGKDGGFVASDIPAILPHTRDVSFVGDLQIVAIHKDRIDFFDSFGNPVENPTRHIDWDVESAKKGNYPHFMLKEIHESPDAFKKTLEQYANLKAGRLKADCFPWDEEAAQRLDSLTIVACGTAYHAGLMGKSYLESMARLPVHVEIASEYRYKELPPAPGTELMLISQSGETADTIAAMRMAKAAGCPISAVCNVIDSTIAREAEAVMFTYAGPEIAVAATKSYLTQTTVLYLLALDLAQKRGYMTKEEVQKRLFAMARIPDEMEAILKDQERIRNFARKNQSVEHVFFIGRGLDHALAQEASLKLKEISYIKSEAYAAGELKHGTIALIEPGTLVAALATQKRLLAKTASNMEEVRVRGAYVLAITPGDGEDAKGHADELWSVPDVGESLSPFCAILYIQLLAYYMAVERGCAIDQPRNLAKSVTVE